MLFASDCPLKEIFYPSDFAINFDIDNRVIDDGGKDDGFAIFSTESVLEVSTEKLYFTVLEWQYTPGRARKVIEYLKDQLEFASEIEFWHIWQDMNFAHRVRKIKISIADLTAEDIQELDQLDVWKEPVTDYCYIITRS